MVLVPMIITPVSATITTLDWVVHGIVAAGVKKNNYKHNGNTIQGIILIYKINIKNKTLFPNFHIDRQITLLQKTRVVNVLFSLISHQKNETLPGVSQ